MYKSKLYNETLIAAKAVAYGNRNELANLGFWFGFAGYRKAVTSNSDKIKKTALQYIENHDHSRFVCNFGMINRDNELLKAIASYGTKSSRI